MDTYLLLLFFLLFLFFLGSRLWLPWLGHLLWRVKELLEKGVDLAVEDLTGDKGQPRY